GVLTVNNLIMQGGLFTVASGGQLVLNGNVTATSSVDNPAHITGAGSVSLNGATRTFTVNDGLQVTDMIVDAILSGSAGNGVIKNGSGRLELDAANTYPGATTINNGDVQVGGTINNVVLQGGSVSGTGTVGTITNGSPATGTVSPGNNDTASPTGILHSNDVTWSTGNTFFLDLNNTTVGTGYDQLVVNGVPTLGSATLAGLVGPNVAIGDSFTILHATGGVVGKFAELYGANIAYIDGRKFRVDYDPIAGGGTDVVLNRIKDDTGTTV